MDTQAQRANQTIIKPLAAFKDNYIWWLSSAANPHQVLIVDPGDADIVRTALAAENCQLAGILVTHHHWDHIDGIDALLAWQQVPVFGPASRMIPQISHPVKHGDIIKPLPDLSLTVIAVPGHTLDHLAYYGSGALFAGDTLFAAGCGRLTEGSPEQMYASLALFEPLAADTQLCCAHEYTLDNLAFAQQVEPDNHFIHQRIKDVRVLRNNNLPSLPSLLASERQSNPFLRCRQQSVINAVASHTGQRPENATAVFAALRRWKDHF